MRLEFNTGRHYTDEGQVILVEYSNDRVWFHDTSRMVAGSFDYCRYDFNEREMKEMVMYAYDHGMYRGEQPNAGLARGTDWEGKPIAANRSYG